MEKQILISVCVFLTMAGGAIFAGEGVARIAVTKYSDWDVPLYTHNAVEDYGAPADGIGDATGAIQNALKRAGAEFGGIVYLPEGRYRITAPLVIPEGVTLRGDWRRPTETDQTVRGTILEICHGEGQEESKAAIGLEAGAVLRDLSIFYPEQSLAAPKEYPYTVRSLKRARSPNVMNVTLVNAWKGIRYALDGPITEPYGGGSTKRPTARNVYGCALKQGIHVHRTTDTPRIQNVHFGPEYWSGSGLAAAPDSARIAAALKANGAIAFRFGDGDGGGSILGISAHGYAIGLEAYLPSSPRIFDFELLDCDVGINILATKAHGWHFTSGRIEANRVAVRTYIIPEKAYSDKKCERWYSELVRFNHVTFCSRERLIEAQYGTVSFVKCDFHAWGEGPAIKVWGEAQSIQVCGCTFGTPPEAGEHLYLGQDLEQALVYGNQTEGAFRATNKSKSKQILIDTESKCHFAEIATKKYEPMLLPRPAPSGAVFDVRTKTYGAVGDGVTDDTKAIQNALNAARAAGGGTVFLPPGLYRIGGRLSVPAGTELRGVHEGVYSANSARTILLVTGDKNKPKSPATITLASNSGVRGLLIYRMDQPRHGQVFDFPPVIRATGSGCWGIGIVLPNTVRGIDFDTGGGHYLDWIYACTLWNKQNEGYTLKLRGDGKETVVQNIQFKTMAWGAMDSIPWGELSKFGGQTESGARKLEQGILAQLSGGAEKNTDAERIEVDRMGNGIIMNGDGSFLCVLHFLNRTARQYIINGAPKARFLLCGGEGDSVGYTVNAPEGALDLEIINNTYHCSRPQGIYNVGPKGRVRIFNTKSYDNAGTTYCRSFTGGGTLLIQQDYRDDDLKEGYLKCAGGRVTVEASLFGKGKQNPRVDANGGAAVVFRGNLDIGNEVHEFSANDQAAIDFEGNLPVTANKASSSGESAKRRARAEKRKKMKEEKNREKKGQQ